MFNAKMYDLGKTSEIVGYYPDALKTDKCFEQIGSNKIKYEVSEEQKEIDNIERAVRRAKTKIRRTAEKYDLKYMWTLTFAKQKTVTFNPKNKTAKTYDVSTWEDAWKLFALFIKRCRKAGFHFNYIVTAEVQEKRLEQYGEKVYHFHMATDKYLPQNDFMRKQWNRSHSFADRYDWSFNDFWTFGYTKATKGSKGKVQGQRSCVNYLVKYITKAFEEVEIKGKQRYHISNGMEITFEMKEFKDHEEFLLYMDRQQTITKDKWGNPLSKYFILGSELEIWWLKIEN